METLNVFDNISEHIIKHIKNAENAIYICVPWLTDEKILIELVEKTKQNVHIEIITLNDEFNRLKSKYFNKLISNGSKVYFIDKTAQGGIPHLKFCVIDDEILITGSYNWSNNARKNDENILIKIINDFEDHDIINDYNIKFNKLLYSYGIKNEDDDWQKVIDYTNDVKKKQEEAYKFYDLASSYLNKKKYASALEFINEGIDISPHPDKNFFFLKHLILRQKGDYLECTDSLYQYLWEIADNDNEEIEKFKKLYDLFIKIIKIYGTKTYKLIAEINQKTKIKLGKFALLNIEPHFFTYDELDTLPF